MTIQYNQFVECSKNSDRREIYSITGLPQETRENANKQAYVHLKNLKENKGSPKSAVVNTKNQSRIKQNKEIIIEKINATKSWFFQKMNKTDKLCLDSLREREKIFQ